MKFKATLKRKRKKTRIAMRSNGPQKQVLQPPNGPSQA